MLPRLLKSWFEKLEAGHSDEASEELGKYHIGDLQLR